MRYPRLIFFGYRSRMKPDFSPQSVSFSIVDAAAREGRLCLTLTSAAHAATESLALLTRVND
jgi:hypothetical protein